MKKSVTQVRRTTRSTAVAELRQTRLSISFIKVTVFLCVQLATGFLSTAALADKPEKLNGYLIPIGGGASYVNESRQPKESQVSLISEARKLLSLQRKSGFIIPGGACIISYQASSSKDLEAELEPTRDLFLAAGFTPPQITLFGVGARSQAQSESLSRQISQRCGLVFLPGGDQTEQMEIWNETLFAATLKKLFSAGGILMGKSAGAAMLGSVVFTPSSSDNTAVLNYLGPHPLRSSDFRPGALLLKQMSASAADQSSPAFLIETHTGDRERAARAAIFLAALEAGFKQRKIPAKSGAGETTPFRHVVLAIDSDTGLVIQFTKEGSLHLRTIGARAVEILSFGAQSRSDISHDGFPFIESGRSDLLLDGDESIISADGRVMHVEPKRKHPPTPASYTRGDRPITLCLEKWSGKILSGRDLSVRDLRSRVRYHASVSDSGSGYPDLVDVEEKSAAYAYLTGTVRSASGPGCGYWQSRAFDFRSGQPENRLNLARFGLASGRVDLAFSLSEHSSIRVESSRSIITTDEGEERSSASIFVQDVRNARFRRVANYIYKDFGARAPVQIGGWVGATIHIVPPGFSLKLEPAREIKEGRRLLCPKNLHGMQSGAEGCP